MKFEIQKKDIAKSQQKYGIILLLLFFFINFNQITGSSCTQSSTTMLYGLATTSIPFEFFQNDEEGGFNVDLLNQMTDYTDWDVEYCPDTWGNLLSQLELGTIDIMAMVKSTERDLIYDFSSPFMNISYGIFVRSDWTGGNSFNDLDSVTVGVQTGDIGEAYLQEHVPKANLVNFDSQEIALQKLVNSEVGAIFCAVNIMYFFIGQQNYQDAVKAVGEIIKIGDYCFAVQEGNSELLAEINASLAIVKENGEYQQIFSDWFDTQMGVKFDINSLYPFIFGGFGFLGALGIYIFVLRRQIAQKSKELEKTQEIILQREKSEALGYLAGGIAHDFNNILTAIIGNISLLELEVKSGSEMEVISKDISMAANKGKSLANRLLTFAKGGTPIKEMVDLNKIIADTSKIALIGSSAKINTEKCQKCPSLKLDKAQISQVFQNIILNANQAMNSQGTITISSNIVRLEHNNQYGLKHKEYIKISISDSGSGISSENMLKIFDPYFSTKSKGTGLGLSTSFSIMKKHGGTITIDSIEGKGATFHLFFPNI